MPLFAGKNFYQPEVALPFAVWYSFGVFGVQGLRKGQRDLIIIQIGLLCGMESNHLAQLVSEST